MAKLILEAPEGANRLDLFLAEAEEVRTRSQAQKWIKEGRVTIVGSNGPLTSKTVVPTGATVEVNTQEAPSDLVAVEMPLDIVYEDEYLLVVNKPQGMVVHPSAGHEQDTLVNYLLHHCSLSAIDGARPGIVHRIDKDTSGLLVVAKQNEAHEGLAEQFFSHTIIRIYEAICWGVPDTLHGTIDAPIGRHQRDRKKQALLNSGKEAITHWSLLKDYGKISLLRFRLETGRTHQIRVHSTENGHPIIGDPVYGKFRNYQKFYPMDLMDKMRALSGQALHAKRLGFVHPITKEKLDFTADFPKPMQEIIDLLEQWKEDNHAS